MINRYENRRLNALKEKEARFNKLLTVKDSILKLCLEGKSFLYITNNGEKLLGRKITRWDLNLIYEREGLKRPSIKDAANSKHTRDMYKDTVQKLYGEDISNVSQSAKIKAKKIEVNMSRYGVENPYQREDIKAKIRETLFEKYGVYVTAHIAGIKGNNGRMSKIHQKVSGYLSDIGIEHLNEQRGLFIKFNEKLNRNYSPMPDIYVPSKKLVFEIYGDLWHMNPKIYHSSDTVKLFTGYSSAEEVWQKDADRRAHIESFGIKVVVLWEQDIKKCFQQIKECINEELQREIS